MSLYFTILDLDLRCINFLNSEEREREFIGVISLLQDYLVAGVWLPFWGVGHVLCLGKSPPLCLLCCNTWGQRMCRSLSCNVWLHISKLPNTILIWKVITDGVFQSISLRLRHWIETKCPLFQKSKIMSFLQDVLASPGLKWEEKLNGSRSPVPESPVTRGRKFVSWSDKVKKSEKCVTQIPSGQDWRWFWQYRQYFNYVLLVTNLEFYQVVSF